MNIPKTALGLGLAGLLPFAASAIAAWVPNPWLAEANAVKLGIAYGGVILSFLGGVRWGAVLGPADAGRQARDFALSVAPALVALAALFLVPTVALALLVASFLLMALWDVLTVEAGFLPQWYGRLRTLLTTGAVLSLLALLVAVFI
jgi:Protein of unknown function (DUF3429)